MTRSQRERPARHHARRRLLILFLLLILGVVFFWSEQNRIVTEKIEVHGVPSAFDGVRIVLISDVHGKEFGPGNATLLRKTAALEPDIIAVIGDLCHEKEQWEMVPTLARGLSDIAPTYYVTGNHEWAVGDVPQFKALLEDCGVHVLSNTYVPFTREGQTLLLLGADDSNGWADQKTIGELAEEARTAEGEDAYLLLLSHRNNRYPQYVEAGIDLTLSGHAHGGLVRLPFTDGLIGPHREWFPHYTAGLYALESGQMVVSRGLGNQFPLFRLFNPPDLPLIILRAS